MSLVKSNTAGLGGSGSPGGALGSFYSHTINQSLRMNKADSPRLIDSSVSSDGNRRKFTFSFWIKFAKASDLYDVVIGAGGSSTYPSSMIGFHSQRLTYKDYRHPSYTSDVITTAVFRDVSAWYHFVVAVDTTQSTAADRVKMYVNGTQITAFDTASYPTQNYDTLFQDATSGNEPLIGFTPGFDYMDGYLAEVYNVDNAQLAPTEFGETKDGVWIPKEYSGSFGTTGYRLTFSDSSSIGADSSGNSHSFDTVTNLAATDVVKDSPTNNFPTMNNFVTVGKGQSIFGAFTEGNLKVRNTASNYSQAIATHGVTTGKYYYECYITEAGYPSWMIGWLVADMNGLNNVEFPTNAGAQNAEQASFTGIGYFTGSNAYISDWGDTSAGLNTQEFAWSGAHAAGDAPTTGDIIGVAADFDNRKLYFHVNGTYINSGSGTSNPSTGANANSTYTASEAPDANHKFPWLMGYGTSSFVFNFGQDDSFAGNKTSGSAAASDSEGIGEFYYAVPTGFKALCASNLPDVTIGPGQTTQADDYFNTVLYTGDGASSNAITGVGFSPDWVWLKKRSGSGIHNLFDTVRGAGKVLQSNDTDGQQTVTTYLNAFGADGFTLGSSSNVNESSGTFVAWNWLAGGAPSGDNSASNSAEPTAGSAKINGSNQSGAFSGSPSIAIKRLSANTTAGFSIVQYVGTGSSGTIPHGLTKQPEIILVKDIDTDGSLWTVWNQDVATDHVLYLHLANGQNSSAASFGTHNDNVFAVDTDHATNQNTKNIIAYCFHSVEGYSSVGSYTGNGSATGTYIYTGFRPVFVLLKSVTGSNNWSTYDNKRDIDNVVREYLIPNDAQAAGATDTMDFLSNGFKVRNASAYINTSGTEYIYIAFAKQPFKFSNAR